MNDTVKLSPRDRAKLDHCLLRFYRAREELLQLLISFVDQSEDEDDDTFGEAINHLGEDLPIGDYDVSPDNPLWDEYEASNWMPLPWRRSDATP